ncbi:MAG: pyrimidine dimer DNA glycosylase/endonuclease V [Thermomicrobiales bacterium]
MRIWDLPPSRLCRQQLRGEHRELHGLWNILVEDKVGYSKYPETPRWRGKLRALLPRHEALVEEMTHHGYRHATPLDPIPATDAAVQGDYVNTPREHVTLLIAKGCGCPVTRVDVAESQSEPTAEPLGHDEDT